jgi:hypothetical protein
LQPGHGPPELPIPTARCPLGWSDPSPDRDCPALMVPARPLPHVGSVGPDPQADTQRALRISGTGLVEGSRPSPRHRGLDGRLSPSPSPSRPLPLSTFRCRRNRARRAAARSGGSVTVDVAAAAVVVLGGAWIGVAGEDLGVASGDAGVGPAYGPWSIPGTPSSRAAATMAIVVCSSACRRRCCTCVRTVFTDR